MKKKAIQLNDLLVASFVTAIDVGAARGKGGGHDDEYTNGTGHCSHCCPVPPGGE